MGWVGRGSRHERGYGAQWQKARLVILARDLYLCQPCKTQGRTTPAKQVDHIKPKASGGTDDHDNLQAICEDCHKAKTAREAAEAAGRPMKRRLQFDAHGNPIWPDVSQ